MSQRHTEILIVGGGPAGTATAVSLARLGHRPLLLAAPRTQAAIEGFSDRTLRAFESLGLRRALDAVGPKVTREAHWGGNHTRVNAEYVVDRAILDAALLADAEDHDIEVLRGRANRVTRAEGTWHVQMSPSQTVTAEFLIEARGRSAPVPSRARLQGPATVSLARMWTGVAEMPATAVAAMSDGWTWYASTGGGRAMLQLVVAAASGDVPKRQKLVAFYDGILSGCEIARSWVAGGRPSGGVVVRRANPVGAKHPLDDAAIRVGDAAVAPDPLSGHGVYVALGGAQAAAVTVNTLLRRRENAALARSFYEERCRLDFMRLSRVGRAFYAEERRWPDSPFWRARGAWPDTRPPHEPMNSHPPRIERRPVVENGFITEHEVIVTPDHPRGVWVVAGVPLVPLFRTIAVTGATPDIRRLAARFGRSCESVELAREWLMQRFKF